MAFGTGIAGRQEGAMLNARPTLAKAEIVKGLPVILGQLINGNRGKLSRRIFRRIIKIPQRHEAPAIGVLQSKPQSVRLTIRQLSQPPRKIALNFGDVPVFQSGIIFTKKTHGDIPQATLGPNNEQFDECPSKDMALPR